MGDGFNMAIGFDPIGALIAMAALLFPLLSGRSAAAVKEVSYFATVLARNSTSYEVHIQFTNSGAIPIRRDDYDGDSGFGFSFGDAEIQNAQVLAQQPPDLGAQVKSMSRNMVELNPILLNPSDSFTLRVDLKDFQQIQAHGRVSGLTRIREVQTPTTQTASRYRQSFASMMSLLISRPSEFFATLPVRGNVVEPFVFQLVIISISNMLGLMIRLANEGLLSFQIFVTNFVYFSIWSVGALLFLTGFYHLLIRQFVGQNNAGIEATFRVVCYSQLPALLLWIPTIGPWFEAWVVFLQYLGIREMHNIRKDRAALIALIVLLLWTILFKAILLR